MSEKSSIQVRIGGRLITLDTPPSPVILSKSRARRMGYNPLYTRPPLMLAGSVIFEKSIHPPMCLVCDTVDENLTNPDVISNGNMLIEYPKGSEAFYCGCCFQNSFPMSVVKRKLEAWTEPEKED